MLKNRPFETVIFDLGGVLIDWNPEYLYRKIIADTAQRKQFLTEVCSPHWNEQQDAGRLIAEANRLLIREYPQFEKEILAFYGRWTEMLGGPIQATVDLLGQLKKQNSHRLYALTNWSGETFPIALGMYDFLQQFEGILVSGHENLKKPDPRIYHLILDRYDINPASAVFIDDNLRNVAAANALGIEGIYFTTTDQLIKDLRGREILEEV